MSNNSTYSLAIDDINDGGKLASIRAEVDKHDSADLNESCESL